MNRILLVNWMVKFDEIAKFFVDSFNSRLEITWSSRAGVMWSVAEVTWFTKVEI